MRVLLPIHSAQKEERMGYIAIFGGYRMAQ